MVQARAGNMFGTRTPTVPMSSVLSAWSVSTSISSRITASSTVLARCFATPTSSTTATCPTPTSSAPRPFAKAATSATSASSATRKAKIGNGQREVCAAFRAVKGQSATRAKAWVADFSFSYFLWHYSIYTILPGLAGRGAWGALSSVEPNTITQAGVSSSPMPTR